MLKRLRRKLLLAGFLPLLLAVTGQAVSSARSQKALMRGALEAKARSLSALLVEVVGPSVVFNEPRATRAGLGYARSDPDFAFASVVLEGGKQLAYVGPEARRARTPPPLHAPAEAVVREEGEALVVTAPLRYEDKTLGALSLGLWTREIAREADAAWQRTLFIALIGGAIAVLLAFFYEADRKRALQDLRSLNGALERASNAKSEFLANMSHEIRTPMAAITGYADLLLETNLDPGDRVSYVQTIRRNSDHLLAIINDILDLSKVESGKMASEKLAVSPAQIVVEVASLLRVRATERNLTLDVEFETPIPATIESDPTRLRQILMNLVSNSIKFTERGGVRILVRCDGPEVARRRLRFEVADTGIGLTKEQIERLFMPFTQADSSTTRKFGGTGLGLVISQRMARLLCGEIEVESLRGRGSSFTLCLEPELAGVPMLDGLSEAMVKCETRPEAPEGALPPLPSGVRVLLAEDGRDNQLLVQTHLHKAGATVVLAEDGKQAMEQALAAAALGEPFDVVLMDMQMPLLDGYGATARLRESGFGAPIVALTAHAMSGDRDKCMAAGCDDYLTKPIDRKKLLGAVAHWAEAGRAKRAGKREPVRVVPPEARSPRTPLPAPGEPIYSELADDLDMRELIHTFVGQLGVRAAELEQAAAGGELARVERIAHQLKGAAGSYGFPGLTEAAETLEMSLNEGRDPALVNRCVQEVASLCKRARVEPAKAA